MRAPFSAALRATAIALGALLLLAAVAAATAAELAGVWEKVAGDEKAPGLLEVTGEHLAAADGDELQFVAPVVARDDRGLVANVFGNRRRHEMRVEEGRLEMSYREIETRFRPEPETVAATYRRLAARPAVFGPRPLRLGEGGALAAERVLEIRAELERRGEIDQGVRQVFAEGGTPGPEAIERMREVDRDNTAWLAGLVTEVGWIDAGRFGREAANAAFLIVQHSGHLPLMLAALPEIEKDARAGTVRGGNYALLYDRTQLRLGRKQRYGSQIGYGPEGMFLSPLEDPGGVDERRAELGLQPLAEYLEHFRDRNGGRAVEIRTEF